MASIAQEAFLTCNYGGPNAKLGPFFFFYKNFKKVVALSFSIFYTEITNRFEQLQSSALRLKLCRILGIPSVH